MALCVFIPLLIQSCEDEKVLCYQYCELPSAQWHAADTLTFQLPAKPHGAVRQVEVSALTRTVRHYPFRNLILMVELCDDSTTLRRDTVQLELHDVDNEASGQGVAYLDNQLSLPVYSLLSDKSYTYRVAHLMRRTPLQGVTHVGLKITELGDR